MEAMRIIGFSPEEVQSTHRILAAILHLVSLAWMTRGGGLTLPLGTWDTGRANSLPGDLQWGRIGCTGYIPVALPPSSSESELVMHRGFW